MALFFPVARRRRGSSSPSTSRRSTAWPGRGRCRGSSRLLGGVVSHFLSPALHNANFEALGLDALYVPFAMLALGRELEPLVTSLDALGLPLVGASVTIPFKEEAAILAGQGRG